MRTTLDKQDILTRLTEQSVQAVYRALGVERFTSGGAGNWLTFVPWRDNTNSPALTIRRIDGVWSDKATSEGGDLLAAVMRVRGCSFPDALQFVADIVGMVSQSQPNGHRPQVKECITATYAYPDESNQLLYQVLRYEPKRFVQRRPDGKGGWIWSLGNTRRVLYRLPELLAADLKRPVLIHEGEKSVDRSVSLGLVSTCSPHGAGKWRAEYNECLRDRNVIIIPDNDVNGRKHAQQVAQSLWGIAAQVRILELPGLAEKGDFVDWVDADGTISELKDLACSSTPWSPGTAYTPEPDRLETEAVIVSLDQVEPKSVDWLWPRWLARGKVTICGGHGGDGKSTLTAWLASVLSKGGIWPDGSYAPKGRVLFLLAEDALDDTLRPRLDRHDADTTQVLAIQAIHEPTKDGKTREAVFNLAKHLPLLERIIGERDIDLVVIDPLTSFMPSAERNSEGDVRDILTPLIALADRLNVAIIGIMHVGKPNGTSRRPLQQLLGSSAFGNVARTVWMVAPCDEEDETRRVLAVVKSNLAMRPRALEWSIEEDAPIAWHGESAADIDDLLSGGTKRERGMSPERQAVLQSVLAAGRPVGAADVARIIGKSETSVRNHLAALASDGSVDRIATGMYQAPRENGRDAHDTQDSPDNTYKRDNSESGYINNVRAVNNVRTVLGVSAANAHCVELTRQWLGTGVLESLPTPLSLGPGETVADLDRFVRSNLADAVLGGYTGQAAHARLDRFVEAARPWIEGHVA